MTVTVREVLLRGAFGFVYLAAEIVTLLAGDEIYILGTSVRNVLLMLFPILMGSCVIFPTRAERRDAVYRLSSPVRLALGTVGVLLFLTFLYLLFTASGWDGIGYFILLIWLLIIAAPLVIAALAFKIVFCIRKRKNKSFHNINEVEHNNG